MTKDVDLKLAAGLEKARAKLATLVTLIDENGTYSPGTGGLIGETAVSYPDIPVMGWGPVEERYIEEGTALATQTQVLIEASQMPFGPVNQKDILSGRVSVLVQLGPDIWRVVQVEAIQGADDVAAYIFIMAQA